MRKVAELASASALVKYGETTVMVAATVSPRPRDGIDFFPLTSLAPASIMTTFSRVAATVTSMRLVLRCSWVGQRGPSLPARRAGQPPD